ncbi:hypothetical protein [Streptomyces sp. NBC_01092]|uniref:hypothetical protein n=1 Tax=Streptomyces sp. NBC_01092 TaxID=2903748 RepID=UPI003865CE39|nr:hypothetical protein OG254_43005 [Streptomyces sp. NBC_01092]
MAVVVPTSARREQLSDWTRQELEATGHSDLADVFLLTQASPVTTPPKTFFFGPLWYPVGQQDAVSLLDVPQSDEEVSVNAPPVPAFNYDLSQPVQREFE